MQEKKNLPLVSVYTCVYNGEKTINRVFESMKNLDYPNIEHVIVNDGSTDRTDELINQYIKEAKFPVKYHKKENGGKHIALNVAWQMAEGYFMIQLDADDRLLPNSISNLVAEYFSIPEHNRKMYWCVQARCIDPNCNFIGEEFPEKINKIYWRDAFKIATKCKGEKVGLQVREYLSQYSFPEVKGLSYIPENIIFSQINRRYGTWYTNTVCMIYYVGEGDRLSAKRTTRKQFAPVAYKLKWEIINEEFYGRSRKKLFKYSVCYFVADKKYRSNNGYLKDVMLHKSFLRLISPLGYFGSLIYRIIKRIK